MLGNHRPTARSGDILGYPLLALAVCAHLSRHCELIVRLVTHGTLFLVTIVKCNSYSSLSHTSLTSFVHQFLKTLSPHLYNKYMESLAFYLLCLSAKIPAPECTVRTQHWSHCACSRSILIPLCFSAWPRRGVPLATWICQTQSFLQATCSRCTLLKATQLC